MTDPATTQPDEPANMGGATPPTRQLVTRSSTAAFQACPRKYHYRYERRLRPLASREALRFGSAFHLGRETFASTGDADAALAAVTEAYATMPDADTLTHERATVLTLLSGYCWRYAAEPVEQVAVELPFQLPLINPGTGASSRTWDHAGKIDGIVRYAGTLALYELKTTSEDIDSGSNYWLRLRNDPQISGYIVAARALGYDVRHVLYDVVAKPSIRPRKATPPEARKYTKAGALYANQRETDETPDEFADRLWADIQEQPDRYFARREIARLDDDLAAWQRDAWQAARLIRECQLRDYWPRHIGRWSCEYCDYARLCLAGGVESDGYEIAEPHSELRPAE